MKTRSQKITASILAIAMIMMLFTDLGSLIALNNTAFAAGPTALQSDTKENTNQAGGIIYTKTSTAKSDGTIDIVLTAHTTGEVRQLNVVTPTDIVLVLDLSGSMDERYDSHSVTNYTEALGSDYTYTTGFLFWAETHTGYGFNNTSNSYYINTGTASEPVYTRVERTGRDDNGYEYYEYTVGNTEVYVYPELESGVPTNRSESYPVHRFIVGTTTTTTRSRMDVLRSAVNSFIDTTATMNEGLAADEMHTISIVKFADNSYYNSDVVTTAIGNHKNAGGNADYNYSEVVQKLVPVDASGAALLKDALSELDPGGATAVDYGLNLAEAVLMERSSVADVTAVDRNEVVIVFTDGEPNWSSGFDEDVANNAIETATNMESLADVTVYGVCIDADADETDINEDINKFMHYMTSNFPNATDMNTPGANGSIDNGYYMTPHDDMTLTMIFDAIIHQIDHPTVTMGEEATMVDVISPYFDFKNGSATQINLQTSLRNADGTWKDPVDDNSLTYTIEEDRLTVNGFDFDENFVSNVGRGANKDFYGKRLVVSFTVVPDYDVIDAASVTLMGGVIPTNSGFALINDSDDNATAEVATPQLSSHQVVYKVDGVEYKTYNRFTGSDLTLEAAPTKEGYTFSGWTTSDATVTGSAFSMPDKDVVIVGTFTPNEHTVTYAYTGTVITGAPALPASHTASFGETVTVAAPLTLTGYVFSGWKPLNASVSISAIGDFTMPNEDVTLVGYFESATTTPYKIEHYLETLTDGVYETKPEVTESGFTGTTGATVTAIPLNRFTGFEYNAAKSAPTISGTIAADGSLVLKVYYDRIEYNVTYGFEGDLNISGLPTAPVGGTFKYGETVNVAAKATAPAGYTFVGWYRGSNDNPVEGSFTMPAFDVHLLGYFVPNAGVEYRVEHYLMDTNGNYPATAELTENFSGTTGNNVTATPLNRFTGFTYDSVKSAATISGQILGDGSLTLKVYYSRNKYQVTYGYDGELPTGAPSAPAGGEFYYGADFTVAPPVTAPAGYTFVGWYRGTEDNPISGTFKMPAYNVHILGYFAPNAGVGYRVEHYLMDTNGNYPASAELTENFTGTTGATVTATPLNRFTGFEYNAAKSASTISGTIAGDGSLVLKVYYDRIEYNVTYGFEGDLNISGLPTAPAGGTFKYGETVIVAAKATAPAGYTFVGWYRGSNDNPVGGSFTMPAYDVHLLGYFAPSAGVGYRVEHYLMDTNGNYPASAELTENFSGTTGNTVNATPLNRFTGFTYDSVKSATTISGQILGDGSLTLKVYYSRNKYQVTYGYDGELPTGAPSAPAGGEFYYGADVTVAATVTAPAGYTFVGWYRGTEDNHISGTFEMPAYNVHILGNFSVNENTPYRVEHYLQNADGSGYTLDGIGETRHGTTGATANALPKVYTGFTFNASLSTTSGAILGDGSLVLKLYYDRNTYTVTYVYEGIVPGTAPAAPAAVTNVRFGAEVTVEEKPSVAGYTFNGWDTVDVSLNNGKFTMPASNVKFTGSFFSESVEYKVNYWLQKIDAGTTFNKADYELSSSSYTRNGLTGQHVEADSKNFTGFYVNSAQSKTYGHVSVDTNGVGNLVLDIYYDRHTYNVTYGYYGTQPTNAPDLTSFNKTSVRYGTELDVEAKPALDGYIFDGWLTHTATVNNGKFVMPAHNVEFLGRFLAEHTVSYDLNGGVGAYGVDYSTEKVAEGKNIVTKDAPERSGFAFLGWKETNDLYDAGINVAVNRDLHFVAQWSPKEIVLIQYTLSYVTNGGNDIPSETYYPGKTVELTKVPEKEGFDFAGWYLDEELTQKVSEVVMRSDITVYAAWTEKEGGHETPDKLNGDDHFAYVVGYPDGTVRPEANITRAEATVIFFRLLKEEVREQYLSSSNGFTDVSDDAWFNTAVSTMANLGIIKGRTSDTFDPDSYITRAEFAAICARFDDSEYETVHIFTDIEGHWAEEDINEAAAHGWIGGYGDGTFRPDQYITRGEAMSLINRVLNRLPETKDDLHSDMITWPDNSDTEAWYYLAVQEATNSHDYEKKDDIYEKWIAITQAPDWAKYNDDEADGE